MNSPVFGSYARYYNLLYKDKDYAAETLYVHELIQNHCPGAKTVLNLGCGTGSHDVELARLGYKVTGVDLSDEMLSAANARLLSIESTIHPPRFQKGDIQTVRLNKTFDVVISLFHVMSYQTTNEGLLATIAAAKVHLALGGCFIFDCWYGPAVLSNPPSVRVKRLEDESISVIRIAEPVTHPNNNLVDVNYLLIITDKLNGKVEQLSESHRMRYLFIPELEYFMQEADMNVAASFEWMTSNCPDCSTWGVCFVVKE